MQGSGQKQYRTNVSNSTVLAKAVLDKRFKFRGSARNSTGQTSEIPWLRRKRYWTNVRNSMALPKLHD